MQNAVGAIPGFGRQWFFATKVQLAVDIIFYQHYMIFFQQCDQVRLFLWAERKTQRILAVSHQPAGFYRILLQRLLQRGKIDPLFHVGGN